MNKRQFILWTLILILCAGLTVQYGCDRRAAPPSSEVIVSQRIISLGPALTEEIYLLGAQDRLVGCTIYCNRPAAAKQKQKVGTVVEVSVEKIVELKPDIVLATSLTDRRAKERFQQLGMRVVTFPEAGNFGEICQQFLDLGKIVGKDAEARRIVEQANKEVNSATSKVKGPTKLKVFLEIGTKPLFTITRNSFVDEFIVLAGGVNIAAEARSGLYSREKVVQQNPDVIIIVSMGVAADQEKKVWQKFSNLSAVKNNRIYVLNPDKVCSPTPLGFAETLKEISQILHPGS